MHKKPKSQTEILLDRARKILGRLVYQDAPEALQAIQRAQIRKLEKKLLEEEATVDKEK